MSTHYGYKCRTCEEISDQWYNRGQDVLREVWEKRMLIFLLTNQSQYIQVTCGYAADYAPVGWVLRHLHHDVCLYNEYGEEEKLETGRTAGGTQHPPPGLPPT